MIRIFPVCSTRKRRPSPTLIRSLGAVSPVASGVRATRTGPLATRGIGVGEGLALGLGEGDADGLGLGEGEADGDGDGEGEGVGVGEEAATLIVPNIVQHSP